MEAAHRVVIVGGGFAGLYAALTLKHVPVQVTVVDRRNFHLFQPLLYQVATGGLSPGDIASPIRAVLSRCRNAHVMLGEVVGFDPARREVRLIVGAGPTGVELAGALSEIARHTLKRDFRTIDTRAAQIVVVEGAERVLPAYPADLSAKVAAALQRLSVRIRTGAVVTGVEPGAVAIRQQAQDGRIDTHVVLWAAGIQGAPLGRVLAETTAAPLDRAGRIMVEPNCTIPAHPEIFVIGDLGCFTHQTGAPLPGVAPVAMQQGRYVARLLGARLRGGSLPPFRYVSKGSMAVIGRHAAVADLGRVRFNGVLAWLAWLFIHLLYLVEFENRLLVLVQWAWNYLTWNRGARLITGPSPFPLR